MAKSKEKPKEPLDESERGEWQSFLKAQYYKNKTKQNKTKKPKIMASGPNTSWQIDGETMRNFIFLGCKITADGAYSHEIKVICSLEEKPWQT